MIRVTYSYQLVQDFLVSPKKIIFHMLLHNTPTDWNEIWTSPHEHILSWVPLLLLAQLKH